MRRLSPFRRTTRRHSRGQGIVEFALILPILLTFLGVAIDFARIYQVWITLQGATRDAAEYVATNSDSATTAATDAKRVVCTQTSHLVGFVPGPGVPPTSIETCTNPTVVVTSFTRSTSAPGATATNPGAKVTIQVSMPFRTLIPYPFLQGAWTVSSTQTYSILQGR